MNRLFRWYRARHLAPLMLAVSAVMLLAGGAAVMCTPDTSHDGHLASMRALHVAYDRVEPGRTLEKDLARLGFDT